MATHENRTIQSVSQKLQALSAKITAPGAGRELEFMFTYLNNSCNVSECSIIETAMTPGYPMMELAPLRQGKKAIDATDSG